MAEIGAKAPGFAGFYIDETGSLVVLYSQGTPSTDAEQATRDYVTATAPGLAAPTKSREVPFSFSALRSALRDLNPYVLTGVHYVDIDERNNRVFIGVVAPGDSAGVAAHAASLGLATGIVAVRVMPRIRAASTLRDIVRPVMGGIETSTRDSVSGLGVGGCSGGAVARIGSWSTRCFLTASHCTLTKFGYDSASIMYQPVFLGSPYRIGVEVMDPPPLYGPPMCPANRYCRQSDVAVYALDDATTPFSVAHTTWVSVTPGQKGSLDITTPAFDVTGVVPYSNLVVGQGLQHVGQTTGWSAGSIYATCFANEDSETHVWVMCSYSLQATMGTGDSGSPVFQWYGGATGYSANMAGNAWGLGDYSYTDSDGQSIGTLVIFSPWQFITYDFGPLTPNP